MSYWLKIGSALAIIWLLVAGAMFWAHVSQPTALSLTTYLDRTDLASKTASERQKTIGYVEEMLNRISFDERQKLQHQGTLKTFFRGLTPDEQVAYLDATLPAGFKQMMESFNRMDSARRKQILDKTLADMKKKEGEPPRNMDDKLQQRMIDQGMRSFYSDANAEVKLDMAPLIEQMQKNLQTGR